MPFLKPKTPHYSSESWKNSSWPEKIKAACISWAEIGYGTPYGAYIFYIFKVLVYIGGFAFFCSQNAGFESFENWKETFFSLESFKKAILYSMAFEALGLGCASGPLTGHYHPIITAFLYFTRPGTTRLPVFKNLPFIRGNRRSLFDVALYLTHYIFLIKALLSPELSGSDILMPAILLPIIGLRDKTIFLASRAEHYYVTMLCFFFPDDLIAGAMAVQLALWFWAGFSKLNHHFSGVVSVMTSNSPVIPFKSIKKAMYKDWPNDLRISKLAHLVAHFGTTIEFSIPYFLAFAPFEHSLIIGLILMVSMHSFITSSIPMAVPIEWNFHVVYGGFFLFYFNPEVHFTDIADPLLAVFLGICLIALPLLGNLYPKFISFLISMRYYAGNWAYSVWLFKGESHKKLEKLNKVSAWVPDQLRLFYSEDELTALMSKIPAFRHMHIHGRALQDLIPKAVDNIDDYTYTEGELVAGMVLGWNFGDGHLHDEELLKCVQKQANFDQSELRCIMIESQPLGKDYHEWRIVDAARGELSRGKIKVSDLLSRQPWPEK